VDTDDLALIKRDGPCAVIEQTPQLNLDQVAEELGVSPRDALLGYDACVFVEGYSDVIFLEALAATLKQAGLIPCDFKDKNIGILVVGGVET